MPGAVLTFIFFGTAIIGLLTVWLGWRGQGPGGSRWCPRCEKDLSDTESRTCDSCGFSSTSERHFHLRRPRWGVVIIGLAITAVSSLGASRTGLGPAANQLFVPMWQLDERQSLGEGWHAEVRRSSEARSASPSVRVRVYRDGAVQFEWLGQFASLGAYAQGRDPWGLGGDIDGDDAPDLIIETRGMDSIERTFILSLATREGIRRLEPVAILPEGRFEDLDDDGRPEYLLEDRSYQYSLGGLRGGPRPALVFAPDGRGGWQFDAAKSMARPMPEDWQENVSRDRAALREMGLSDHAPVHAVALELLYRGRSKDAKAFLRREFTGNSEQIDAFENAVTLSPLNSHLQALPND